MRWTPTALLGLLLGGALAAPAFAGPTRVVSLVASPLSRGGRVAVVAPAEDGPAAVVALGDALRVAGYTVVDRRAAPDLLVGYAAAARATGVNRTLSVVSNAGVTPASFIFGFDRSLKVMAWRADAPAPTLDTVTWSVVLQSSGSSEAPRQFVPEMLREAGPALGRRLPRPS